MVDSAPPRVQLVTGQYEFGKDASLTWNSAFMASAATVMAVPLMRTVKVPSRATAVTKHLADLDQLKLSCQCGRMEKGVSGVRIFDIVRFPVDDADVGHFCLGHCLL